MTSLPWSDSVDHNASLICKGVLVTLFEMKGKMKMPKIIKNPTNSNVKKGHRVRIYKPDGDRFEKEYQDINQMKRFRKYYKDKGFRTRAI